MHYARALVAASCVLLLAACAHFPDPSAFSVLNTDESPTPFPSAFVVDTEKQPAEVIRTIRRYMRAERIATTEVKSADEVMIMTQLFDAPPRADRRRYQIAYAIHVQPSSVVVMDCLLQSTGIYERTPRREDAWGSDKPCDSRILDGLLALLEMLEGNDDANATSPR